MADTRIVSNACPKPEFSWYESLGGLSVPETSLSCDGLVVLSSSLSVGARLVKQLQFHVPDAGIVQRPADGL